METEEDEIKARIAELKARYARLERACSFGARISPRTTESYAREIEALQNQMLTK